MTSIPYTVVSTCISTKVFIINSPVQTQCPASHPNVYYNGEYCCQSEREKFYWPQGTKCDGSQIQRDSLCCEGDRYIACPSESGVCESYSDIGYIILVLLLEIYKKLTQ